MNFHRYNTHANICTYIWDAFVCISVPSCNQPHLQLYLTPYKEMKFTLSNYIINYNLHLEDPGIELCKFISAKHGSTFICPPNG